MMFLRHIEYRFIHISSPIILVPFNSRLKSRACNGTTLYQRLPLRIALPSLRTILDRLTNSAVKIGTRSNPVPFAVSCVNDKQVGIGVLNYSAISTYNSLEMENSHPSEEYIVSCSTTTYKDA